MEDVLLAKNFMAEVGKMFLSMFLLAQQFMMMKEKFYVTY
jgi:hypothetical protein